MLIYRIDRAVKKGISMPTKNTSAKFLINRKLQEERLQRGWTQQEVADRVGTTVINVSRWERGVTTPGPYFRQQLCLLFEKDMAALGLLPPEDAPAQEETTPQSQPVEEQHEQVAPSSDIHVQTASAAEHKPVATDGDGQAITRIWKYPSKKKYHVQYTRLLMGSLMSMTLIAIVAILIVPMIVVRPVPKAQNGTTDTTPTSPPLLTYSFEDGSTEGWVKAGNILQLENSSVVGGYDGSLHALQVTFFSRKGTDQPYISVNPHVDRPRSGETLSAAIFVPNGTGTDVAAKLYVQDMTYTWHSAPLTVLSAGKWNVLRFRIPPFAGSALQIGVQFLSVPPNILTKVYVDAVELQR
jgi:transcriptional regulator with XRE-family HTH domain